MVFHHVGIACKDIPKEIQRLKKVHTITEQSAIVYDELQDVHLCMVTVEDGFKMEFVSGKTVETFIKKGITKYHLCFECDNLDKEIETLITNGAVMVSPPKPAILFGGKPVAFLLVSYGLIELLQK